jgi:hypothetical protein
MCIKYIAPVRHHIQSSFARVVIKVLITEIELYAKKDNAYNSFVNIKEPPVLYIGRAYRYSSNVAFYVFFNKYKYRVF